MHTALVTGGTDGIGRAIARRLAANHHNRVIVVGRDAMKGMSCVRALQTETANPAVEFVRADLSTVAGADLLASAILSRGGTLRYLVHSAGTITKHRTLTTDGYEMMFATNFLARFVLTEWLESALERGSEPETPAHILFVSGGPRGGALPFNGIPNAPTYSLPSAVQQYCLANDLYALHLSDRARRSGAAIDVACLKLGPVKTSLRREFPWWMKALVTLVFDPLISQTADEAAGSAVALLEDRAPADRASVLFTKVRKLQPLNPTGRLADPDERRRLVKWAEWLVNSSRHASSAAG
jgi:NAD(P)-dependent dehydrogenase (short-subunit alcohol dehydrogenase family)